MSRHLLSREKEEQGFTLIEMLIVIVILGVLSGIVVFAVSNLTSSSVQTACKSDYKSVEVAVETYKAQVGLYPTAGQHGIPAAATDAVPVATSGGLLAGDTADTPNLGPWLRDQPTNGHHYQIEVPLTAIIGGGPNLSGSGDIQVYVWNSTSQTFVLPGTPPGSGATQTIADCSFAS